MKHAYVVTERIPSIEKMPNVRDHDASVYLKLQVGLQYSMHIKSVSLRRAQLSVCPSEIINSRIL